MIRGESMHISDPPWVQLSYYSRRTSFITSLLYSSFFMAFKQLICNKNFQVKSLPKKSICLVQSTGLDTPNLALHV